MGSNDERQQQTLTGESVDEDDSDESLNDVGEPYESYESKGEYNRYELSSLLQKAVRRNDRERAMFCAWELSRSGYAQHVWRRLKIMLVEDIRLSVNEAVLVEAVDRLKGLAEEWGPEEGMGQKSAMRAASLLAEAESSRELFYLAGHWEDIAEDRLQAIEDGLEPAEDFPVEQDLGDVGYAVRDMHTYAGKGKGRGYGHYLVTASRTSGMTELGREAKRKRMEHRQDQYDFTDPEYEVALRSVDNGDPWPGDRTLRHHRLDDIE